MAALYDPRYNYPNDSEQRNIGSKSVGFRNYLLSKLYTDHVPPEIAALSNYDQTASYAAPALTEAQLHARNNEPAVNMFTGADGELYPAGHPMLTKQDAILSDNTDETGAYLGSLTTSRQEAAAETHRRAMLTPSAEMHGNAMLAASPAVLSGDPDTFETLVERYLQEQVAAGEKRNVDAAFAKAEERMEMGSLDSLQTNLIDAGTGALEYLGGIREGGILSAGKDEDGAFARLVRQAEERRDNTSTELTRFGKYLFPDAGGPAVPVNEQQQQNGPYFPEMPVEPAALTDTTTPVTAGNNNGALTVTGSQNTKPAANRVRASTGGYTGNARGSGLPDMQIGLGERMMRMGVAGLSAGAKGPLAQMGAMTGAYNDVNQANRTAEMGNFKIEEERRQKHADRVAKLAAAKAKFGDETRVAATSARIALDNANAVLKGFDDFDNVTGPFNWFVKGWDSSGFGDAGRANVRLKIAKMKVDSTLARVAETKGAISEKEMKIFESDQPSFYATEDVWSEWVTNYIGALKIMNTNLQTGQTPYKNGGGGVPDQETEDLVKKYSQ